MTNPRRELLDERLANRTACEPCMRKFDAAVGVEDVQGERNFFWGSTSFMILSGLVGLYIVTR
jgi:hypothetical protein